MHSAEEFGEAGSGARIPGAVRDPGAGADMSGVLAAARRGDDAAFLALFRAVQPGLLRYLTLLAGEEAGEVASGTWLRIARELGSFSGDYDAFRGWVSAVGRSRAMELPRPRRSGLRRAAAGQRGVGVGVAGEGIPVQGPPGVGIPVVGIPVVGIPVEGPLAEGPPDRLGSGDGEGAAPVCAATAEALALMAALPRVQAEAVLLRVVMDLDAQSAARVLGKRAGAVRRAAHRGLRTLARLLEQQTASRPGGTGGAGAPRPRGRNFRRGVTPAAASTLKDTR
ncbi:sigma factor-like helix-turn-helix DNA-binding protein [Streptomyces sp. NPDC023588]|uniref:RNA polymerase sigma factor n=1 Tax=Streptomyces sp. NPDC023588 TaxID=3154907 RepID=UPI0033F75284